MGTRGLIGIRYKDKDKCTYNHYDSYPTYLGKRMLELVKYNTNDEILKVYNKMVMVKDLDDLNNKEKTQQQWQGFNECFNTFNKQDVFRFTDDIEFIKDSLFCEYAYIMNLDKKVLEFYAGFQKDKQKDNRYGETPNEDGYYPGRLFKEYSFDDIRNVVDVGLIVLEMDLIDIIQRAIKEVKDVYKEYKGKE